MNKTDFIEFYAKRNGTTKKAASEIVENMIDTMSEVLINEGELSFLGFGKFEVKERAERIGTNPRTGEKIRIEPARYIYFKAGKILKEYINE